MECKGVGADGLLFSSSCRDQSVWITDEALLDVSTWRDLWDRVAKYEKTARDASSGAHVSFTTFCCLRDAFQTVWYVYYISRLSSTAS
jgi:hypothetical protein